MSKRIVALIDGEHYLPVTRAALEKLGDEVVAAVFIGGMEKIGTPDDLKQLDVPVVMRETALAGIRHAIEEYEPDVVFDLSDEPVVGYNERMSMACEIMSQGVIYKGPDFEFTPPGFPRLCEKPSMAVIGTGKRIGKTAITAHMARVLNGQEGDFDTVWSPCIVTMGRGGPAEPELIKGDEIELTPSYLVDISNKGTHASSDHYEDALMARITTVGCRRCGGGFSGRVFDSTVPEGVKLANKLPADFVLFEGSGASFPDVAADATVAVVGANQPLEYISGFMGPYRIDRADLVVITLCEYPSADPEKIESIERAIREINPVIKVVRTIFRPRPLIDVTEKKAIVATTAPLEFQRILADHLATAYACEVLFVTHNLSNRPKLRKDLSEAMSKHADADVLITELKAASVDVAAKSAIENGLEVVFMDNVPETAGGDGELDALTIETAKSAQSRFSLR
ncbi:MAG: 2,3-diphosphoglycerate synthetase [Candidatus Coatesbacteria bacterium]|nr:2,3-diphosphoglycerate synthetase [Candidatus Coatesbacteria bacterium]